MGWTADTPRLPRFPNQTPAAGRELMPNGVTARGFADRLQGERDEYAGDIHRKSWILERLAFLTSMFAIDVCGVRSDE